MTFNALMYVSLAVAIVCMLTSLYKGITRRDRVFQLLDYKLAEMLLVVAGMIPYAWAIVWVIAPSPLAWPGKLLAWTVVSLLLNVWQMAIHHAYRPRGMSLRDSLLRSFGIVLTNDWGGIHVSL